MHHTPLQKAPLGRVLPEYEIPTPRFGMNRLMANIVSQKRSVGHAYSRFGMGDPEIHG